MAETAPQPEPLPTALSDADSFRYYPAYHVLFHDRSHHLQPGDDRQGQQTLPHVGSQFAQCHAHRLRHGGLVRVDLPILVVLAQGGPLPRDVLGGSPEYLPHGKTQNVFEKIKRQPERCVVAAGSRELRGRYGG